MAHLQGRSCCYDYTPPVPGVKQIILPLKTAPMCIIFFYGRSREHTGALISNAGRMVIPMVQRLVHWKTALQAASAAAVLVGLKILVYELGIEFIELNALFTSLIAGGIFLFGLILAGTLSDYKESEKIPSEIVSACASIHEDGLHVKALHQEFDLVRLDRALLGVLDGFHEDAGAIESRKGLEATEALLPSFIEMEKLGVPPNYIVRLKGEEGSMRRTLMRMYYIQRTGFLPSAYILVESIVALILTLLVFVEITPLVTSLIIIIFLTYLFVFILRLLKTLDRPFWHGRRTRDDVSLFLVDELREKLTKV